MEKEQRKRELWGLEPRDILVIFALWSINYVRPWFAGWHSFTYNMNLQRVASFLPIVFICECFMCIGLALICDIRYAKYKVYMHLMFLYGILPVYGLVETLLPSFTLRFLMDWLDSTSGIIFPVQFAAVFLQKPNISRMDCYIWLIVFQVVGALNNILVPWTIPYDCPLPNALIIPLWVVMLVAYWQVLFLVCYAHKYAKQEDFREKHLKTVIQGIALDRKVGNDAVWWRFGRKTLRFSMLAILLVPVLYSTLLSETLYLVEVQNDLNVQPLATTTHTFPLGSLFGTVAIAAVLIFVRWKWPNIADVCTLGIPHLLNLTALMIITVRILGDGTGNVLKGAIPDKSSMVLLFINTDYNNRSACIYSDDFESMRIRAMEYLIRVVRTGKAEIQFDVVLDPAYDTFLPTRHVMKVRLDSYIVFMVQLGDIPLRRDFVVNAVQLVEVKGVDKVRPKAEPQYLWMTSISEYANKTMLRVSRNGSTVEHDLPEIGQVIIEDVPSVLTRITVVHKTPAVDGDEFKLAQSQGTPKPYTVYGVVIHEHNNIAKLAIKHQRVRPSSFYMWPSRTTLHVIPLMKVRRPAHQRLPSRRILRKDPVIAAAYFIHGAADALVTVGYLHLFWLDAPLRLRTSMMAVSRIIMWFLGLLPDVNSVDYYSGSGCMTLAWATVLALLVAQLSFTVMHFVFAHFFYSVFPDDKLAIATSPQVEGSPSNEPGNKAESDAKK